MSRPSAVMVGGIGKLPYGGMSLYYLHYLLGLAELGYELHYVERQNRPLETYDPSTDEMTDRPDFALRYLDRLMRRYGIGKWSFVDRRNTCHGAGWPALRESLERADFLLTVADPTWFDELGQCRRRLFVDGDPMFTQVDYVKGEGTRAETPHHYDTLFTYARRIGAPDCLVPAGGREWIGTCPVVATRHWLPAHPDPRAPIAVLMHWAAGSDAEYEGGSYGHKDREFERVRSLPSQRPGRYLLAAGGGGVPRGELARQGWELVSPLRVTGTIDDYVEFVRSSRADLGIAKHAYVASRSGWFSDRSTCYLAAGRPVLHQDTGYTDWLPVDEGVLPFSDRESLVDALDRLDRDYDQHAEAARRVAEEHFEARSVLAGMLEEAGIRRPRAA